VLDWRVLLNAATKIHISLTDENLLIKSPTTDSSEEHCTEKSVLPVNTHPLVYSLFLISTNT